MDLTCMNIVVLHPPERGKGTPTKRLAFQIEKAARENIAVSEQQELLARFADSFLNQWNQTGSATGEGSALFHAIEVTGARLIGVDT